MKIHSPLVYSEAGKGCGSVVTMSVVFLLSVSTGSTTSVLTQGGQPISAKFEKISQLLPLHVALCVCLCARGRGVRGIPCSDNWSTVCRLCHGW